MSTVPYDFIWVNSAGSPLELTAANGYTILAGVYGLDAPPVELFTEARTEGDGSVLVKRRTGVRSVALPMYVNTGGSIRTAVSLLADVFRGPGQLRVSDNGSTFRTLRDVYYETGLEGDEGKAVSMPHAWRKAVISLQALDPWWYANAVGRTMTLGATTAFDASGVDFDDPDVPFDGGSTTTFQVDGHADAYPVWTIAGPFTTCVVVIAGSESFELAAALADGDTITVDTRPGTRGPSLNGAAVDWSLLTAASRLGTFPIGTTSVSVSSSGTDGGSSVSVTYEPRWLTP
jgi:hypothetical protein